jgi:hypothetical protein
MSRPQPKPGDVLLGCVHRPNPYAAHIFQFPRGMNFRRPDGTLGEAKWLALCDVCFQTHVADPTKAPIGCDLTWPEKVAGIKYKEPS